MQNILPKDRVWRYKYKFKNDSNEIKAHVVAAKTFAERAERERNRILGYFNILRETILPAGNSCRIRSSLV